MARKPILGSLERPRLVVSRSLNNMYVQLIDDTTGTTILGLSSVSLKKGRANVATSQLLGGVVAELALKKGIKKVVFDRGGYIYHGRVKAVADGAREKGLEF